MISTNLYQSSFIHFSNKRYRPFHIKTESMLINFTRVDFDPKLHYYIYNKLVVSLKHDGRKIKIFIMTYKISSTYDAN